MEQTLNQFRDSITNYATELLKELDVKIDRLEEQLNSLDFKTELFKFEKRLSRIEINKFGYSLSTHNNGR